MVISKYTLYRIYLDITKSGDEMFEINNQYTNANISRTIRFTDKLFEDLNKVAEKNNISFNMLVLQCCRYALDHLGQNEE